MKNYPKYLLQRKGINYFDTPMQNRQYESMKFIKETYSFATPENKDDSARKSLYKFYCENMKRRLQAKNKVK